MCDQRYSPYTINSAAPILHHTVKLIHCKLSNQPDTILPKLFIFNVTIKLITWQLIGTSVMDQKKMSEFKEFATLFYFKVY